MITYLCVHLVCGHIYLDLFAWLGRHFCGYLDRCTHRYIYYYYMSMLNHFQINLDHVYAATRLFKSNHPRMINATLIHVMNLWLITRKIFVIEITNAGAELTEGDTTICFGCPHAYVRACVRTNRVVGFKWPSRQESVLNT